MAVHVVPLIRTLRECWPNAEPELKLCAPASDAEIAEMNQEKGFCNQLCFIMFITSEIVLFSPFVCVVTLFFCYCRAQAHIAMPLCMVSSEIGLCVPVLLSSSSSVFSSFMLIFSRGQYRHSPYKLYGWMVMLE